MRYKTFIDMTGMKICRWEVLKEGKKNPTGQTRWHCRCECGTERVVLGTSLRNAAEGKTRNVSRSCGCLKIEEIVSRESTHGHSIKNSRTYRSWAMMIQRCANKKLSCYPNYGGRGITVCERWHSFENFLADMGERPEGTSLDRFPNTDGNYELSNCRWATNSQQARNKRNSRQIKFNGETHCIAEWAERIGIRPKCISERLLSGWSIEDTLTQPIKSI